MMEIVRPNPKICDPSQTYRPEHRDIESFRNFVDVPDRVRRTYDLMHTNQTVESVRQRTEKWCKFNHAELTVMEALLMLDDLVDESDPDIDLPNSVHAFQTAEAIRRAHPNEDWFHLTGLIHDMGKMMAFYGEPHYAVCGDTYPVGCQPSDEIVFGRKSFNKNPDTTHPVYSTKLGIYKENTGLENVTMSWGHDEYMYRVLRNHKECTLPEEGLAMIRYHSFYPWHTGGDYNYLCNDKDKEMMKWILEFNKFDLYTKCTVMPDVKELMPYYQSLVDKYIPGKIKF